MRPEISIIIPVYNAEHYLDGCIGSILTQDFTRYEIILVDDGSTDGSVSICKKYAEQDNILLVEKKNGGPNEARAYGLRFASADWVTFVDSDDKLMPRALHNLFHNSSDNVDIIVGFSFESDEKNHSVSIQDWRRSLVRSSVVLCAPWGKLFRRSILSDNCFATSKKNMMGEDMTMNIRIAYSTVKDVVIIQPQVYCYNDRVGSVSKSAKWTIQNLTDMFEGVRQSIPESDRENVLPQLIENRFLALEQKIIVSPTGNREQNLSSSPYLKELREDVERSRYRLTAKRRSLLRYPDSVFTVFLYKFCQKALILKEFLQRKLHLNHR